MAERRQGGFTLLEVLVAMVLLSTTLTLAFAGLQQTARGWQAQIDVGDRLELQAAVDELLRRQLLLAIPDYEGGAVDPAGLERKPVFEGDSSRARWLGPLAASGAGSGLYQMALAIESDPDAEGGQLVFSYALDDPAPQPRGEPQWQRRVLLRGLPDLRFSYWGRSGLAETLDWHDQWQPQDNRAPLLLRIEAASSRDEGDWPTWVAPLAAVELRQ